MCVNLRHGAATIRDYSRGSERNEAKRSGPWDTLRRTLVFSKYTSHRGFMYEYAMCVRSCAGYRSRIVENGQDGGLAIKLTNVPERHEKTYRDHCSAPTKSHGCAMQLALRVWARYTYEWFIEAVLTLNSYALRLTSNPVCNDSPQCRVYFWSPRFFSFPDQSEPTALW